MTSFSCRARIEQLELLVSTLIVGFILQSLKFKFFNSFLDPVICYLFNVECCKPRGHSGLEQMLSNS